VTFDEVQAKLLAIADSRDRVETDAATPEQIDLCAAILQLAKQAPDKAFLIYGQAMSVEGWEELARLYTKVGEQAMAQARTVQTITESEKLPKVDIDEFVTSIDDFRAKEKQISEHSDSSADSAVQIGAWIALGNNLAVDYEVDAKNEIVRFNFCSASPDLTVVTTKEALKHCVGEFQKALADLEADS
jgi:hypothetical protein